MNVPWWSPRGFSSRGLQFEVNTRVHVFWKGKGEWFTGFLDAIESEHRVHVSYDGGEQCWHQDG